MSWDLTVLRAPPGTALGAELSEDDLLACLPLGPRAETLARVALAHGSFVVQALANAAPLVEPAMPILNPRPRPNQRKAAGLRVPAAQSEPTIARDASAAIADNR